MSELHDPRVLFAAERTLLAWQRTAVSLMAFGFVVERFGLFVRMIRPEADSHGLRTVSLVMGIALILIGSLSAMVATVQYRAVLRSLQPEEYPTSYCYRVGVWLNYLVAAIGLAMAVYFLWDAV